MTPELVYRDVLRRPPLIGAWLLIGSAVLLLQGCEQSEEVPRQPPEVAEALRSTKPASASVALPAPQATARKEEPATAQWFREITAESGVDMRFTTGATGRKMTPEIAAGGLALFDADGDGRPDLYVLNGNHHLPNVDRITEIRPGDPVNRLFRNVTGDDGTPSIRFVCVTEGSGLDCPQYGFGVAVGDIDNNGQLDLFISNLGPDRLFRNRGDGTFEDITESAGLGDPGWGTSCLFLDFNRSGHLDLFVTRYVVFAAKRCSDQSGRPEFCGPREYPPVHDLIYRNEGDGRFTDISETAGISALRAAGLGVVADDFDDDGWIDIYVANDAYANHMWINRRNETFTDMAMRLGTALNMFGEAEAGMGVVAADFGNNTRIDLFMTHLMNETNTFYFNHGGRRGFTDITADTGLAGSSLPWTGFGVNAFDADLDGFLDLFIANGRVYFDRPLEGTTMPKPWNAYAEPNLFYRNRDGRRFDLLTGETKDLCAAIEITRGSIAADLDGDGRLDLVMVNIEAPVRLFRNETPPAGRWLMIRAIDPELGRDAVGARVMVDTGEVTRTRTVSSSTSYLAAGPYTVHFGLGHAERYDRIRVRWPDGLSETFPGGDANRTVVLTRGEGSASDP